MSHPPHYFCFMWLIRDQGSLPPTMSSPVDHPILDHLARLVTSLHSEEELRKLLGQLGSLETPAETTE